MSHNGRKYNESSKILYIPSNIIPEYYIKHLNYYVNKKIKN